MKGQNTDHITSKIHQCSFVAWWRKLKISKSYDFSFARSADQQWPLRKMNISSFKSSDNKLQSYNVTRSRDIDRTTSKTKLKFVCNLPANNFFCAVYIPMHSSLYRATENRLGNARPAIFFLFVSLTKRRLGCPAYMYVGEEIHSIALVRKYTFKLHWRSDRVFLKIWFSAGYQGK